MSDSFEFMVGRICVERGWLTEDRLDTVLREHGWDPHLKLSDRLVGEGYLRPQQLKDLREELSDILGRGEYQVVRRDDVLLGQILLRKGAITSEQLQSALEAQKGESWTGGQVSRLGDLLLRRGAVTFQSLKEGLVEQAQMSWHECPRCRAAYGISAFDSRRKYVCRQCGERIVLASTGTETPDEVRAAASQLKNRFGKYVVAGELGRGGMGMVHKAWDGALRRWVALKVLTVRGTSEELARFQREARTAASLSHPGIVRIYEVGEIRGRPYLAMELLEGQTLAKERLLPKRAAEVIAEVARAVHYAHAQGVVHRDLTPHNIMLDLHGKPHVMDFGLAKHLQNECRVTLSGTVVGSPSYMPPEQARGKVHQIDRRSDVYSLGAVLYEMLTGRPPFRGRTAMETLHLVVHTRAIAPCRINPTIPRRLEGVVLRCMEKEKRRRYPTGLELAEDLDRWLQGRPPVRRSGRPVFRVVSAESRMKAAGLALSVGFASAAVGGGAVLALPRLWNQERVRMLSDADARVAGHLTERADLEDPLAQSERFSTRVLDREPNDVRALYQRGLTRFARKDWSQAVADLERCGDLDPELREVVEPLVVVCRRRMSGVRTPVPALDLPLRGQ